MIEAYAFLAAFIVQVATMSILCPSWVIRYVRAQARSIPSERFAQVFLNIDHSLTLERYLARYRALNTIIAALGVVLMGWSFKYTQRHDWSDGPLEALINAYFIMQASPLGFLAWIAVKYSKLLESLLGAGKRKAVLQRRELFDFVSPLTVFLAVLAYFLFVAFVLYIEQNPFPGFHGYISIAGVTLVYASIAFSVYWTLFGRKANPFEPHEERVRTMALGVKAGVYSCIAIVVFLALNFTLVLLDLQRWEPFAQSVFFSLCGLLSFAGFTAPRRPGPDGEESHMIPRDLSA